jgi:hypothetical protein
MLARLTVICVGRLVNSIPDRPQRVLVLRPLRRRLLLRSTGQLANSMPWLLGWALQREVPETGFGDRIASPQCGSLPASPLGSLTTVVAGTGERGNHVLHCQRGENASMIVHHFGTHPLETNADREGTGVVLGYRLASMSSKHVSQNSMTEEL